MPSKRAPLPPNSQPLVIAHRGASAEIAEHTAAAYVAAIELGADGLECDVRLTRDGHLVCVHDRRVDRTSNGRGLVSELDLPGLRELDFSSWHRGAGPERDSDYLAGVAPDRMEAEGTAVLTLETLLGLVADAGRPIKLFIETKHPTRYGGLVEKALVRAVQRFGWGAGRGGGPQGSDPITIMSFAPTALRRIRLLAPAVPLVLLMERWSPIRRDGSLPSGVGVAGPGLHMLRADPDFVDRAHDLGNQVYCWTVDEPADVRLVTRCGVDAIITNRPASTRGIMGRLHGR